MSDVRINYGPIMLDGNGNVDVFVEIAVPQDIADEIENGNDDVVMDYDPRVGYVVNEDYYISSYMVAGNQKFPISYSTYKGLVKDSQNW